MALTDRIQTILNDADQPLSTNAIADRAGVEWHTANKRLETMEEQGRIHRSELNDRLTLWWDRDIPL